VKRKTTGPSMGDSEVVIERIEKPPMEGGRGGSFDGEGLKLGVNEKPIGELTKAGERTTIVTPGRRKIAKKI